MSTEDLIRVSLFKHNAKLCGNLGALRVNFP